MPGFELFGTEERTALLEWWDSNNGVMFAHGFDGIRKGVFKVREFERAMAAATGAAHTQAVSSGSAALLVALRALGVRPGDEVITQSFTFVATAEAIIESGATPVFAEVDESLNMDPDDLLRRITPRTRVVIPVHMAGAPCDMERILQICGERGIPVLEDAAQAVGGTYRGRTLGTLGAVGTYSFDFAKNLTTGEGGMVLTNDPALFEAARAYHDHGHEYNRAFPRGRDTRSRPGFNFRLTEAQAALGLVQLGKLPFIIQKHRENKAALKAALADLNLAYRRLHDPDGDAADTLIFFLPTEDAAAAVARGLGERGVGTKNLPDALTWHFAGTWHHLFHDFPSLAHADRLWPQSASLLGRAIALPVTIKATSDDIARTADAVHAVMAGVRA